MGKLRNKPATPLVAAALIASLILLGTRPTQGYAAQASEDQNAAVDSTANEIENLGDDAGVLGMYWDADAESLIVLQDAKATQIDIKGSLTSEVSIQVRTSALTRADINGFDEDFGEGLQSGAIPMEAWATFFDPKSDSLVVEGPSDDALGSLLAKYEKKIEFRQVLESDPQLADRSHDSPPFWGGSRFTGSGHGCTLGFSVRFNSNSVAATVTAGHCWPIGFSPSNLAGFHAGPVVGRENPTSTPSHDSEILSQQSYGGKIYVGQDAGASMKVLGAGNATSGSSYCMSGATSFEHCGAVAVGIGIQKCFPADNVCVKDLIRTTPSFVVSGDSGGPFYLKTTDGVYARGTIVGHDDGVDSDYFQMWSYIASRWAVSICTVTTC